MMYAGLVVASGGNIGTQQIGTSLADDFRPRFKQLFLVSSRENLGRVIEVRPDGKIDVLA